MNAVEVGVSGSKSSARPLRVLLAVSGASYGHLYPLLPLARGLMERGHELAVAAPSYFADVIASTGLEAIPLGASEPPSHEYKTEQTARDPFARGRGAVGRYLEQAVADTPPLRVAVEGWRADVLVRETTAYGAWFVGELENLPVAVLDFVATPPKILAAILGDLFADARSRVGLPPDPRLDTLNGLLHMIPAPPGWFPRVSLGPTTHLVQPAEPPPTLPAQEIPAWLAQRDASRPLVYVTLGTMWNRTPGVFENIFEALAAEPVDAVAALGPDLDPAAFAPLPDNVRAERFFARELEAEILARADMMICHGGYGALMNALRNGLVIVDVPLATSDAAANAARVKAFGVGIVTSESACEIRDALRAARSNPDLRAAANRVRESITRLPTLSSAAALVERLARECRPVLAHATAGASRADSGRGRPSTAARSRRARGAG